MRRLSILLFVFCLGLLPSVANAQSTPIINSAVVNYTQEGPSIENIQAVQGAVTQASGTNPLPPPVININKDDVKLLEPNSFARLARTFQYSYQRAEQPRSLVIASPDGKTTQIINNPEHYLNQHSFTLDFSEMFPASSDLALMVKRIYAKRLTNGGDADSPVQLTNLCGSKPIIMCLAVGLNPWKRALSGISVTASLSERSAAQQNILVPQPTFSQHYGNSGQIDFDPTRLFMTAANWKNAILAAQSMRIDPMQPYSECFQYLADIDPAGKHLLPENRFQNCIRRFGTSTIGVPRPGPWWKPTLKLFIPKFQFKRTSQFDFIKNGGTLIPAPFPSAALNSYTITWDLRRVIAPTNNRMDAFDAITEDYKSPGTPDAKVCMIGSGASTSYVNVPPTFAADSCRTFATSTSADRYGLACISSNGVSAGPMTSIATAPDNTTKPASNSCKW
jgi:hypothetical protein